MRQSRLGAVNEVTPAADLLHFWTTHIQSLRLWVMQLVAWLAAVTGDREMRILARNNLRQVRKEVRFLLTARLGIECREGRIKPKPIRFGGKNPEIDRHISRRRFVRFTLRGVCLRTLSDCKHVLDHVEACIARCAFRLVSGVAERPLRRSGGAHVAVTGIAGEGAGAPDTS